MAQLLLTCTAALLRLPGKESVVPRGQRIECESPACPCDKDDQPHFGCRSAASSRFNSRFSTAILPLSSAHLRLPLECCVQFWSFQYKKDQHTGECPTEGHQTGLGLEHRAYEDRLKEWSLLRLEEIKLRGNLIAV